MAGQRASHQVHPNGAMTHLQHLNTAPIPLLRPVMPPMEKIANYLSLSYAASQFTNNGPCVSLFEQRLQERLGLTHKPLLLCNATIALSLVAQAYGWTSKEDLVIVPSFTFSATAHSIMNVGGTPFLVDSDPEDWHAVLPEVPPAGCRGIVVVQTLGYSADYRKYEAYAAKHNLKLIFDSAPALGAKYPDGKLVGTAGDVEIFSMHATKSFGIGEGSLLCSNDGALLAKCRQMINFGLDATHQVTMYGINAKMSDFHAAVGLAVLDEYDQKHAVKASVFQRYVTAIQNAHIPVELHVANQAFAVFPVLVSSKAVRDKLAADLTANNITVRIYYTVLHRHPYFANLPRTEMPVCEDLADRIICLPSFEQISDDQINTVVRVVSQSLGNDHTKLAEANAHLMQHKSVAMQQ